MKETIELKNVAVAKSTIIKTFPQWSDYGVLTEALFVAYKDEDGKYQERTFVTEDMGASEVHYEVNILSTIDPAEYYQQRFERQWLNENGYLAKEGMFVRVVKGRKYAKDTEFLVDRVADYEVPNTYGKMSIRYLNGKTKEGMPIHINAENCVIIGWDKETPLC